MTPYELNLIYEVYHEKALDDQKEKVMIVWIGEYYHRQKKLPSLQKCLAELYEDEKQKKVMNDEEMFKKAQELNALFGGTVI